MLDKGIVNPHGGNIRVESTVNEGSRFTIELALDALVKSCWLQNTGWLGAVVGFDFVRSGFGLVDRVDDKILL